MSARERYIATAHAQLGKTVLWAARGPDEFDCSGLATWCLKEIGGPDLTHLENAQGLFNGTRALGAGPTDNPLPGDLVFFGHGELTISHVAILVENGQVISADGATSHITSLAIATANPSHRVRLHPSMLFRPDEPYVVVHRNAFVDTMDGVSQ